jgi:hypothetical protein
MYNRKPETIMTSRIQMKKARAAVKNFFDREIDYTQPAEIKNLAYISVNGISMPTGV